MTGISIKRRGILGLLLGAGAGAAAPPIITVKAAAAALGVSEAMTATEIADTAIGSAGPPEVDWQIINMIETTQYEKRRPMTEMPAHIASKKSWSQVYKASVNARETAIIRSYIDKLRRDRSFLEKALESLYGGSDEGA